MSASKDKIIRKQQIAAGTDKHTKAAEEAAKKRRKTNIQYTVVAVLLVIVFAFIFIYNSAIPTRRTTAVTIDGQKYSAAQLNYYYSNSYMNFYNTYGDYVSYGMFFDPQTSLADQQFSEDMTWREYFLQSAVSDMTQIHVLNAAAEAEGFTLPAEEQEHFEQELAQLESAWPELGYSSLEQYINLNFGKGVDMNMIREELYRTEVASAYAQQKLDSFDFSADELAAYYSEHADELDTISYAYVADYSNVLDAEAAAAAVNGTDEDTFTDYLVENYEDLSLTSTFNTGSELPEGYAEWLLDAARVPGDAAAFTVEDTPYVVMFLDRAAEDYHPVDFRHILIRAEDTDGDGAFSDEEIAAAAAEAQSVYDEWKAGAATEDSFAELANTYTDDAGSSTNGGLYEDVTKGQMVEPIDTWLFDESRQPGDTEILSYDGHYTGTHVVFFVGEDDLTAAQVQADNVMRTEAYNNWLHELTDAAVVETSHLKMSGKNH